jgi:hypothetical protein
MGMVLRNPVATALEKGVANLNDFSVPSKFYVIYGGEFSKIMTSITKSGLKENQKNTGPKKTLLLRSFDLLYPRQPAGRLLGRPGLLILFDLLRRSDIIITLSARECRVNMRSRQVKG